MLKFKNILILAVLFIFIADASAGELRLPSVFADQMVLQRDKPVQIWGWAAPGKAVTVRFAGQTKSTPADTNGKWSVTLDPMKASFEGRPLVVESKIGRLTLTDVLVGEVWLCGGQSNMEWPMYATRDADLEIPCANYPAIRYLRLPHIARLKPQIDIDFGNKENETNWRLCTPEQVNDCTGIGYYFARRLYQRLNVPIGLIDTSWGGTMAQHWVTKETLATIPEMKSYIDNFETAMREWREGGEKKGADERLAADMKAWQKQRDEAKAKGESEPRRPNASAYANPSHGRSPSGMYNGMIAPLAPFAIRGVLFYQGENNSFGESWKPFPKTFPAVISDWRKAFGDENLPFGIIQIAGWSNRRTMTYDMNHHTNVVREIQTLVWQRTPGTGLIVTYDTNSNGSIHPTAKMPVGDRSARWALSEVYGETNPRDKKPLEWRGPLYKAMEVKDGKVIISFEEETARGLRLDQDDECGFYIAGKDQVFHNARARVNGETIEVWSEEVPAPAAVRYSVSNLPVGRLMNQRELPAYPFRTDAWPIVPHQSTGTYEVGE